MASGLNAPMRVGLLDYGEDEAPPPGAVMGRELEHLRVGDIQTEVGGYSGEHLRIGAHVSAEMRHYEPSAESHCQTRSYGVGHIPYTHLGGELVRVDPLGDGHIPCCPPHSHPKAGR